MKINLNDEKKNEEKKIHKSTNDIFYINCSNNDKSNNKENISKIIVVKKMNRSKSNFQMKIALTLKEREEKKKQLIERIKKIKFLHK